MAFGQKPVERAHKDLLDLDALDRLLDEIEGS